MFFFFFFLRSVKKKIRISMGGHSIFSTHVYWFSLYSYWWVVLLHRFIQKETGIGEREFDLCTDKGQIVDIQAIYSSDEGPLSRAALEEAAEECIEPHLKARCTYVLLRVSFFFSPFISMTMVLREGERECVCVREREREKKKKEQECEVMIPTKGFHSKSNNPKSQRIRENRRLTGPLPQQRHLSLKFYH